ncbi:MAG TPA: 16S rRNA processing protein RimM [Nitrospina sp.]|jgi:16S rRNA processing protein RimM|nr:16S rRNA processing protein RimM [Nitrospina sp.]|tara:strand:- start:1783 stop:2286 length:504 start_codon:yes stop_codon:yes gene_type:complete
MDWIPVGRVTRTHGLKGELKFFPADQDDLVVQKDQQIRLGETTFKIKSVRGVKSPFIVKFEGVDSIEAAQSLSGQEVLVAKEDFESLPEGEYYRFEIEGLKAFDDTGKYYGVIEEIIATGSNDVYVVRGDGKEWLVPMIDSVVQNIDLEEGKLIFHCVEGLFEDTPV